LSHDGEWIEERATELTHLVNQRQFGAAENQPFGAAREEAASDLDDVVAHALVGGLDPVDDVHQSRLLLGIRVKRRYAVLRQSGGVESRFSRSDGREEPDLREARANGKDGGRDFSHHVEDREAHASAERAEPVMGGIARDDEEVGAGLLQESRGLFKIRQRVLSVPEDCHVAVGHLGIVVDEDSQMILVTSCGGRGDEQTEETHSGLGSHASEYPDNGLLHPFLPSRHVLGRSFRPAILPPPIRSCNRE
jgi:hypothetical protein